MKKVKDYKYKDYAVFIWLLIITIILIIIFNIYTESRLNRSDQIKQTIDNIYLKKIVKEITKNLKPRYTNINYVSKSGDTYENIINSLDIDNDEKK